jgi:hypothetical protein
MAPEVDTCVYNYFVILNTIQSQITALVLVCAKRINDPYSIKLQ